jgi:LuxR family maltose regulon positive regulatory protein
MHKPLNENKWYELDQWLTKISDSYIQQSPVLLIAQMWVLHHKNVIWAIPDLINKVEEIKDNNIEIFEEIRPQLIFFKGLINFWSANVEESLKQFDYVRKNVANDKLGTKSLSIMYYANASQMTGKGDEVYKEIQLEISRNNLHSDYKIILLASLIYIKLLNGDLYTAERIAKRIGEISSTTNNDFYVVWYEFFMGYIAFQQYRLDEALAHFNKTMDFVYFLNTHAPVDAFAGILLTLGKMNKKEKFEQIYNQLSLFTHEWNNPAYNTIAHSLKARLAIAENNLQKASENLKKAEMFFDSGILIFNIEVPRITNCKLLLAKKSHKKTDEAIKKLTGILDFVNKINNIPQTIEVLILLSVAYYKKNNLQKAVDKLTEALGLAEKGHFIYPFVEQAAYINSLLPKINSTDDNINDFISILRKKISNNNSGIKNEAPPIENLSNRELDVIHLLAQRLSNKEIAEKLFISPTTVKKHTINIYQKLDVNKRLKAVAKAKEIGIIN